MSIIDWLLLLCIVVAFSIIVGTIAGGIIEVVQYIKKQKNKKKESTMLCRDCDTDLTVEAAHEGWLCDKCWEKVPKRMLKGRERETAFPEVAVEFCSQCGAIWEIHWSVCHNCHRGHRQIALLRDCVIRERTKITGTTNEA